MKLRTKIMMLVAVVVAALLLLNHYPVSMSLRRTVTRANASALADLTRQFAESDALIRQMALRSNRERKTKQGVSTTEKKVSENNMRASEQQAEQAAEEEIAHLARRLEESDYCSTLTILDVQKNTVYQSDKSDPEKEAIQRIKEHSMEEEIRLLPEGRDEKTTLMVALPIHTKEGELLGQVIASLRYGEGQTGLQEAVEKTQRDLNAMTMLVMLIALFIGWDLTDKIKGSMFNLEPEEIAQLLVERNALIDAVRDGIIAVNEEGEVLHCNRTASQLCQENVGHEINAFSEMFPEMSLASLLARRLPLFDYEGYIGKESIYVNFIPLTVDNSTRKTLLMTFRPKKEVVRFAEDITGVKSYIEALRAQMHEFHNKLQVVSGLVHEKNLPALQEYIDGLLHLKQREKENIRGKIHDPILGAFLLSKFDRAAEKKVDLLLTERSHEESVWDSDLVQDLVVISGNLLDNAFDAAQTSAMRMVTLEITETEKEITIAVWNSGEPIPEAQMEHIFEYGVTSKKEGNGIGLYLVKKACARHKGYVSVTSDKESGTEFVAHIIQGEEA